jgi:hypothetical protein
MDWDVQATPSEVSDSPSRKAIAGVSLRIQQFIGCRAGQRFSSRAQKKAPAALPSARWGLAWPDVISTMAVVNHSAIDRGPPAAKTYVAKATSQSPWD